MAINFKALVVPKEEKAHAVFGASSSERWLNCPGSVPLTAKAPEAKSSSYAEEGTEAHEVLEIILKAYISGGKPYTTARMLREKYGDEMVDVVMIAFKWIEARHKEMGKDAVLMCETRVDLPVSEPGQFGTTDAILYTLFGRLVVIDFKYGAGVVVNVENNSQGIFYALGTAHKLDYNFEDVEIVIIQPRAPGGDENPVKTWVTTIENLIEWRDKFEKGIIAAKKPNALIKSGSWCKFCPAATICPEISTRALTQAKIDFDPVDGSVAHPEPRGLTIAHLPQILDAADRIETWISKVREHAHRIAERGTKIPGWKLVAKRSTRKYVDPEKAATKAKFRFGSAAFTQPELLSPAQLEKAVGKKEAETFLEQHTTNLSSGTRLAPESDSAPEVSVIEADFERIDEKGGTMAKAKTKAKKPVKAAKKPAPKKK